MAHYRYLIVGGGITADAAVRGIRRLDGEGSIGLIGEEPHPPYDRPPLSKGLWEGDPLENIWRDTEDEKVEVHTGRVARTLDPRNKRVVDDRGDTYTFDKLLLATGGAPRRLPFGGDRIIYFRTLSDYQALRALSERGRRFAVIGGGFIGSELAAALAMNDKEVVMVIPEEGVGTRAFPPGLVRFLNDFYRDKGVEILSGESVNDLEVRGEALVVKTSSGKEIEVDGVTAGIGIEPDVELAEGAGLEVDNGIVVDESLRTSAPDIYAAGDVANFYSPDLDKRRRVEHEDNANAMGLLAGRNMAGESEPYLHLPFFYSDLFDLGYEAVGEVDSRLETVEDWKEYGREGVVYHLRDGRVRGVLLWNVWGQVEAARRLISDPGPFTAEDLKGWLPESR